MKFTPITKRLPKLDTPLLINVLYDGNIEPTITDSELWNDPCSTINPCFNMGSAKNYIVMSWAYMPKPKAETTGILFGEMYYNEIDKTWDKPRQTITL